MTSSRVLIALLVAATVLVDLVACIYCVSLFDYPTPAAFIVLALIFSQVDLLAAWVGLRRPASPWPWTCLVGFIVLCILLTFDDEREITERTFFLFFLLTQAGFVIGSLWIVRLLGVTLVKDAGDATSPTAAENKKPFQFSLSPTAAENKKPFQFSLGQLFGWMIGLAVCLGLLRCVIHREDIPEALSRLWHNGPLLLYNCGNVAIVFLALLIALGKRWPAVRGAVLFLTIVAATTLIWMSGFVHPSWGLPATLALCMLPMVGSLWVVRMAGYRLTLRKKTSARSGVELGDERDSPETPNGDAPEAPDGR